MTHGLGFVPDPPAGNASDPVLSLAPPLGAGDDVASATHLIPEEVFDQRGNNSCVGWAIVTALWAAQRRSGHEPGEIASAALVWFLGRLGLGTRHLNAGMHIRGGVERCVAGGFARERYWERARRYDEAPPLRVLRMSFDQRDGLEVRRIVEPRGPARGAAAKEALAQGIVLAAGWDVTDRFLEWRSDRTYAPEQGERIAGGHAMVIHAYDPERGFLLRNSHGDDFGVRGDIWVAEEWAANGRDMWGFLSAPAFSDEVT